MAEVSPFSRSSSIPVGRSAGALALLMLVAVGRAGAQSVTVPAFTVAMTPPSHTTNSADLAEGADGSVLIVWDEHVATLTTTGDTTRRARFSTTGSPLPVASGPEAIFTPSRKLFPRIAAYGAGGYAVVRTIPNGGVATLGLGSSWDALGAGVSSQLMGSTDMQSEGRGGAVATLDTSTIMLVWNDADGVIVGHRWLSTPLENFFVNLTAGTTDPNPFIDLATSPSHGIIAAWGATTGTLPHARGRLYDLAGNAGPLLTLSTDTVLRSIVVSVNEDRIALVGTRPAGTESPTEIWGRYFTIAGVPLGADFPIYAADPGIVVSPDAAFDLAGNLYVVWTEGDGTLRAVGVAPDTSLSGPPVTLASGLVLGDAVRTIRLRDSDLANTGRFMNVWTRSGGTVVSANVTSLCTPGTSTCGDGVHAPFCEFCDQGPGNSDTAPDACRTDCRPARCGDAALDAGEGCDDGNREDCDGCSATCAVETALGCGDGVPFPACGEVCDDGNLSDGDGCSATCRHELVASTGGADDCAIAWSVDNPSNAPRLTSAGLFNPRQACVDDDPSCDFDGGLPGSCTFHVRMCVNNTTLPGCTPAGRLAIWTLDKPSPKDAAKSAAAAQVAAALNTTVPSAIVGTAEADVCSPTAAVTVPLRASAAGLRLGKRGLRASATRYDGTKDTDKLELRCVP